MITSISEFAPENPKGFIVIDGVNGAGKGTLIKTIRSQLEAQELLAVYTREPGGTALGAKLRSILLESTEHPAALSELLLFSADRAEHVARLIRPALEQKRLVISDRYHYSTTAFQGYGREQPVEPILRLNEFATAGLTPDLVILLDLEPEEGLRRASNRSGANAANSQEERDRLEGEELAFHQRVRAGFLDLARKLPESFIVLDAYQPAELVAEQAMQAVNKVIKARKKTAQGEV